MGDVLHVPRIETVTTDIGIILFMYCVTVDIEVFRILSELNVSCMKPRLVQRPER